LRKKIDESDLKIALQTYAKFRLYGELEPISINLSRVLACEQLTTTIDLAITSLKVVRVILNHEKYFSDEVITAAKNASFVLNPIAIALGIETTVSSNDRASANRVNAPHLEIAARAIRLIFASESEWAAETKIDGVLVRGLASQLSTRDDGVAAEELAKEILNLNWLPTAFELGDVSLIPPLPKFFGAMQIANGPFDEIQNSIGAVLSLSHPELLDNFTRNILNTIEKARTSGNQGQPNIAIQAFKSAIAAATNPTLIDTLRVLLANELHRADAFQECLEVCAQTGIENEKLIPLLPLLEMFQGIKWSTLSRLDSSIDLSISLNHFLRVVEDRKVRTFKRYSIEELMRFHKCTDIVELPSALLSAGVNAERIEYFFSQVCDIFSLELLPGMGESKKVRLIRCALLKRLSMMHTKHEVAYSQEASAIEEALQVDDGIYVLDDSKVYVDEQAILNFVNQELAADFQRYLKLVEGGLGVSESLNDVLKSFNNPSAKTFQIPKNDADDLLAELVSTILHRFLFDPASGLDIIIGRRIRHGTIAGEIRGLLEKAELIGHKPRAGASYGPPLRVENLSSKLDARRARIVYAAFSRFSESIDQLIALLRDEYFHVYSTSQPRGIFNLQLNPVILALARSVAQTCNTIEQFSKECLELFWFALSWPLEAARPSVEIEIKKSLQLIFAKVVNEVRALGFGDSSFFIATQQASEELQRRASTIAGWLRIPKIGTEGKTFSLQRIVDVSVAVVTGQKPGFKPIVNTNVPSDLELDNHGFSIVSDALYIALVNVAQHSGKKSDNVIDINIRFNSETSHLFFEIIGEVLNGIRTPEQDNRLANIRLDIKKRNYSERARRDRHSGLFKLAAIVGQSDKTSISFGYTDSNHFRLQFELIYIGISGEIKPIPLKNDLPRSKATQDLEAIDLTT